MSPLLASPNRGYADWQRVENWDTGTLWNIIQPTGSGFVTSPALDVSRSAYIGGYMDVQAGDAKAVFSWYNDSSLTTFLGSRELYLTSNIIGFAQLRLPNLGPYLQVTLSELGAAQWGGLFYLFGTNRYHPLEVIPHVPVLFAVNGEPLAASGSNAHYPKGYYAGPLTVHAFSGQAIQPEFDYLDPTDAWVPFASQIIAASTPTIFTVTVPPGAWRCVVFNQTASATTDSLRLVPSMTGST